MLLYVIKSFWNPRVWLPPNVTWSDIVPNEKIQYTDHRHLYYPLPMAIVMLLIRCFFEKCIYSPLGIHLGIQYTSAKKPVENKELEKIYRRGTKITHEEIEQAASQAKMTERQVERWLRIRKSIDRPTPLTKFCESGFRFTYYTFSFIYGLVILWDKPWLWNIKHCLYGYPHQGISKDMWWYYMINLSFYWSSFATQFFDVKRKDFWQMMIHHLATIGLMSFSWVCNFFRVGSLVLLVHDCADIFLEGAKMANYSNYQKLSLFVMFTLVWIITRLGLYPFWIMKFTIMEGPQIVVDTFPAYHLLNCMLVLLLSLHIFWTYLIFQMVYKTLLAGNVEKDIRSSSEEDIRTSSEQETEHSPDTSVQENGLKKIL